MTLFEFLKKQSKTGRVPFHMPGHMRQFHPYLVGEDIDFTEIDGLDDLHAPGGVLKNAMSYAAGVFGAAHTFFLVNGSTGGILSAVRAVSKPEKTVIIARNCHKSVYNALTLCGSKAGYIFPNEHELGFSLEITPDSVKDALRKTPDACAVVITSPTYDGVISDVRSIADICHSYGVPLIVDSAHGAHLGFLDPDIPSAVSCGADIVVTSLHKTMPSLTQTGLLHLSGSLVDKDDVAAALALFETSSPSYVLMASIDGCVHEYANKALFDAWRHRIGKIRSAAADSAVTLTVPGCFAFDESKLIVSSAGYSGEELAAILREKHNIEPEMVSLNYVLLLTGAGLSDRHVDALCDFFASLTPRADNIKYPGNASPECETVMTMADAVNSDTENIPIEISAGRICAELITPYPPGIPIIAPGEKINDSVVNLIRYRADAGVKIISNRGAFLKNIRVVR